MTPSPKARAGILRRAYAAYGLICLVLGILSTGWLVLMAHEWILPWKSLAVMAPPGARPGPPAMPDKCPPAQK
jgi:hypothetical protein